MFRPIDTLTFDTDWPLMGNKIRGLRDARVIVIQRPGDNRDYPCNVVVSHINGNQLTFMLASRSLNTPYQDTALTVTASGMDLGKSYRGSNDYMIVDIVTDGTSFSPTGDVPPPYQIVPCCVMWIPPVETAFNGGTLPEPSTGWTRDVDFGARRIVYYGWLPGTDSDTPSQYDDDQVDRLRVVNGMSPSDLQITADGDGLVETDAETGTITLKPAMRDLTDAGRVL